MLISVIVPIFNAEKYLDRCLNSLDAALKNLKIEYEVLLTDNNSQDDSLKKSQDFAKKHKNFKVLKCDTPGAAAVRNFGMKKASGKYVWFIDADDEVKENSVKLLLEKAETKTADLVMMGATRVYDNGHTDYLSAVDETSLDYKSRFVRYGAGPWQFLIRRKWWDENGFSFHEGMIHEDMEMISSLILYTDRFASVDQLLYIYYQNDDSVLHKKVWDGHAFDIFPALEGLYKRFEKAGAAKKYHDELEWFFIWNLLIDSAKDFARFPEGRAGFVRSREMLRKYFPDWRRNQFLHQKPLKLRVLVRLNYYK